MKGISLFIKRKKLNWHKIHPFSLVRDRNNNMNPAELLREVDAIEIEKAMSIDFDSPSSLIYNAIRLITLMICAAFLWIRTLW